jgi:hypothetical protein
MESTLQSVLNTLPSELHGRQARLKRIDFREISLSGAAMQSIHTNVMSFFGKYAPEALAGRVTQAKTLALLLDQLYMDQETGELILCADLHRYNMCLTIDKNDWSLHRVGLLQ